MPRFDHLQRSAVNKVNNLYGYSATWMPSIGGAPLTGMVLFKDPTNDMELDGIHFMPENRFAEYNELDFVGLKLAVDGNSDETLDIEGTQYNVRVVKRKYDGKTNIAVLEQV